MKEIRGNVRKLLIPVLIEQTSVMLLGVINIIMAGHLGKEALSALGMIDAINLLVISFFSALAIGGTVILARYEGAGNHLMVKNVSMNTIFATSVLALVFSLLIFLGRGLVLDALFKEASESVMANAYIYFGITIVTYPFIALMFINFGLLRGIGNTKIPMKISILMNIVNLILGYVMIFGLDISNQYINIHTESMGIKGAAYAIALARVFGSILSFGGVLKEIIHFDFKFLHLFKMNKDILKTVYKIGLPAGIETMIFNGGKLVLQVVVVGFGTAAIAASTVSWSIFNLFMIPAISVSIVAPTIISQYLGKDKPDYAKKSMRYMVVLGMCLEAIMSVVFFLLRNQLIGMYTSDVEVIAIALPVIKSLYITVPVLFSASFIIPQALKGGGDVKYTLVIALIGMWVFRVFTGYLLGHILGMGILGLWLAMYLDWLVRVTLFIKRAVTDKWIHKIL